MLHFEMHNQDGRVNQHPPAPHPMDAYNESDVDEPQLS